MTREKDNGCRSSRETAKRVAPIAGYPEGWHHRTIAQQMHTYGQGPLARYFRGLDASHVPLIARRFEGGGWRRPPATMDGLLVVPKMTSVAKLDKWTDTWPIYNRALRYILDVLKWSRSDFVDNSRGAILPDQQALTDSTMKVHSIMERDCPGDFLVFPVQSGELHAGKSVEYARQTFVTNEFGLDSFSLACLALTHPERFQHMCLDVQCPGAEYLARTEWQLVPFWCFFASKLRLSQFRVVAPHQTSGAATGVYPIE